MMNKDEKFWLLYRIFGGDTTPQSYEREVITRIIEILDLCFPEWEKQETVKLVQATLFLQAATKE